MLRVGVIGVGAWGQYVVRDLLGLGCAVTAVATSEASRTRAAELGVTEVVARLEDVGDVDGFVVVTPSSTHAEVVESILPRGVPVFVEKPLTTSVESAARLVELAGDRLFVMHKWRYHPGVEAMAAIAASGELGPVRALRLCQVDWGCPHADVDVVWILAPHCLSIAYAILGELPEPRWARAEVDTRGRADGLVAALGDDPWVALDVSARHPRKERRFGLYCRDGVAELDGGWNDAIQVTREGPPGSSGAAVTEQRVVSSELPLWRELREFVEHLGGGPPPRCSAAEGLAIVTSVDRLRDLAGLARS